ncbi:MAG: 6-bladed beta-propeller, partial [Candidatus Aminicenantes bacterium]|nr:6-bladed beta-propeller [Candidatus Aminicenantes bacterium]
AVSFFGKQDQFHPSDVDISGERLYVCDVRGHKIHVLNKKTGETIKIIGQPGSLDGELFHPSNICIENNKLYVSDTTNFRVQIFDLEGQFLGKFGQVGDRPGDFSRNKGIAVDRNGRIYVVDAAFENLQVFSEQYQILMYLLGPGTERYNINLPAGVAVDYDSLPHFKKYIAPGFRAEYLVFVTSNFGLNKVNVYAFGTYNE